LEERYPWSRILIKRLFFETHILASLTRPKMAFIVGKIEEGEENEKKWE
jgi:hypothetical protein